MAYRNSQRALRALNRVAMAQGGYFTAAQGVTAGYLAPHLSYHVRRGNFLRIGRGLYRIPTLPIDQHDDFIRHCLWSRGLDGIPQAVVSHKSALLLHDISDILPGKVHIMVPRSFRRRAPRGAVLHYGSLKPAETQSWGAFRVTTPLRTIIDTTSDASIPTEQLEQALREALARGLVRRRQLESAACATDERGRLRMLLARIA